jgi:ribosomal subunit interface protein
MKFNLSTEHITLGTTDLQLMEEKMERLEKMLHAPFIVDVRLSHDKHHRQGQVITCRFNIKQSGEVFHAERASDTVQNAVDLTLAATKKELLKFQDKRKQGRAKNSR